VAKNSHGCRIFVVMTFIYCKFFLNYIQIAVSIWCVSWFLDWFTDLFSTSTSNSVFQIFVIFWNIPVIILILVAPQYLPPFPPSAVICFSFLFICSLKEKKIWRFGKVLPHHNINSSSLCTEVLQYLFPIDVSQKLEVHYESVKTIC
jgi:hypothetical protein